MKGRWRRFREVRKFLRNRQAVLALLVIGAYLLTAVVAWLAFDLEDTRARVGPRHLPGFFLPAEPDRRLDHGVRYIEAATSALETKDVAHRAEMLGYRGLRLAEVNDDELWERVDEAWDVVDEFDAIPDLRDDPRVPELLGRLEEKTGALFAPLDAGETFRRDLALLLGTDRQGRSILVRGLYGVGIAIQVGFFTAIIAVLFGSFLGAAAAYWGGWIDHAVIFLYTTFSSIPNLVLLSLLAFMFASTDMKGTLIPLYAAFCATFWIGPCRVVRGETLKIKELEYVQAANAVGFSQLYVLLRHVIPNTFHLMFINFSLLFIGAIKSEVILTFLGLGVDDVPSWGRMIAQSGSEVNIGFFWQIGSVTALMFGLVLAFNIVSDALQDAFDPKHV